MWNESQEKQHLGQRVNVFNLWWFRKKTKSTASVIKRWAEKPGSVSRQSGKHHVRAMHLIWFPKIHSEKAKSLPAPAQRWTICLACGKPWFQFLASPKGGGVNNSFPNFSFWHTMEVKSEFAVVFMFCNQAHMLDSDSVFVQKIHISGAQWPQLNCGYHVTTR